MALLNKREYTSFVEQSRDYGDDPTVRDLLDTSIGIYCQQANRIQAIYQNEGERTMQQGVNRVGILQPYLKNGNVFIQAASDMHAPITEEERIMDRTIKRLRLDLEDRNEGLYWWSLKRDLEHSPHNCGDNER